MTAGPGSHEPRLLVGVDDHPATLRAVGWAAREATLRGGELELVQVRPPTDDGTDPRTAGPSALLARARRAAHEVAAHLVVHVASAEGPVGPVLADAASTATLLVTGSRAHQRDASPGVGRTVAHVLGHAPCPVVVVPPTWTPRSVHAGEVVVGIDGSPPAVAAAGFAADTAVRWGVPLVAVTVGRQVEIADVSRLGRELAEALAGLASEHPDLRIHEMVRSGTPGQQILHAAGSRARLLVLAAAGHTTVGTPELGSTCRSVIAGARCPVAVLPASVAASSDPEETDREASPV